VTSSLPVVLVVAAAAGALHLIASQRGANRTARVTKAMPIALLLAWVAGHTPVVGEAYRWLLVAGLAFSMGGDVFLLSPSRFRAGLASFFVGHVCYFLAFTAASGGIVLSIGWTALLVATAAHLLYRLWPHVARERLPVACYVTMITAMALVALGRALAPATPEPSGWLAALGALVFMVSDATLAFDRFVRPWPGARVAVMVTYYAAQMLIAASVAA
jgi:uncharacterized membrane protein YhhN